MNLVKRLAVASIVMLLAAPLSADLAKHVYLCDQDEDVTDDQVEAMAAEWLAAAKKVEGGENLVVYLSFPLAAKAGETDFLWEMMTPTLAEWADFMSNYPGSAAEDIDDKYEDDIDCGNASLWESMKVE